MAEAPRLLVDEMLNRLGRWLRIAGYDVAIAEPGARDSEIAIQAEREGRLLITRDRKSEPFRHPNLKVICLKTNDPFQLAQELSEHLAIDWDYRPFTRCSLCNRRLEPLPDVRRVEVPESARSFNDPLWICPVCDRIYWDGSHAKRMRRQIEKFARGDFTAAS